MINEKELNTLNTFAANNGVSTDTLQAFENELSWEIEGFTYDKETLINEVSELIQSKFNEPTEAIKKRGKIIFPLANNSAFLNIEYKTISASLEVVRVTDLYID